jgi:hypothetical protein
MISAADEPGEILSQDAQDRVPASRERRESPLEECALSDERREVRAVRPDQILSANRGKKL